MKIGTKQIILFVLAASLILVGYKHTEIVNFFKNNTNQERENVQVGEDDNAGGDEENEEDIEALGNASMFFAANRLTRDTARGKTKETYENITKDANATQDAKTAAYDKITKLAEIAECESKIENLIREKGFADAFAVFNDLGEIDILVNTGTLNENQVVQITDIIIRHGNVDYSDIHIRKAA